MTPCDTRPCPVCGQPFSPTAGTYKRRSTCSDSCHNKRRKRMERGTWHEAPRALTRWEALPDSPPREAEMGPPHPLLLPPDVERQEREALERRVLDAWEAGCTAEAMAERFGYLAGRILARRGIARTNEKRLPAGLP